MSQSQIDQKKMEMQASVNRLRELQTEISELENPTDPAPEVEALVPANQTPGATETAPIEDCIPNSTVSSVDDFISQVMQNDNKGVQEILKLLLTNYGLVRNSLTAIETKLGMESSAPGVPDQVETNDTA